jgi:RNA recognition motif-containing protein
MTVSLYVGNLPFSTDQTALKNLFTPFGEVISAKLIADRDTGRTRGFGFVEMEAASARKAISSLDGSELEGRKLKVNESEKRQQRSER